MYVVFLAIRYMLTRRIAYFSIVAVTLAVAMVIVVHSVMTGFLSNMERNCRRLTGDVVLEADALTSFPLYDEFIAVAKAHLGERLEAATPVVRSLALMKITYDIQDFTEVVRLRGIRIGEYRRVTSFGDGLFYDRYFPGTTTLLPTRVPTLGEDHNGVAVLPAEYEAAFRRFCTEYPDDCVPFERRPYAFYPGPGRFFMGRPPNDMPTVSEMQLDTFRELVQRLLPNVVSGRDAPPPVTAPEYAGELLHSAILGIELAVDHADDGAVRRRYAKGTEVHLALLVPNRRGTVSSRTGRTAVVRYVDDSRTRVFDVDQNTVYCGFDWLQDQLDFGTQRRLDGGVAAPRASEIQFKLRRGEAVDRAAREIAAAWQTFIVDRAERLDPADRVGMTQRVQVRTWSERYAHVIAPVRNERILALVLFVVVSGVAIVVVGCIFYLIVQERTRDIGIVRSCGATTTGVGSIFIVYAVAIGVIGAVVGSVMGVVFVQHVNELQDWLVGLNPNLRVWSPSVFAFDRIPDEVRLFDVVIIAWSAVVASAVGSLIAARRAARIWPVSALRFE